MDFQNNLLAPSDTIFVAVAISPENMAFALNTLGLLYSVALHGKPIVHVVSTATLLPGARALAFMDSSTLLFSDSTGVQVVDISLTINCQHYPFLVKGLKPLEVSEPEIAEVYMKYKGGVTVTSGNHWSFVGYKKLSKTKCYDGGEPFHFMKALLCFQLCTDNSCMKMIRSAQDTCCVDKEMRAEAVPTRQQQTIGATSHCSGKIPLDKLTAKDGLKVF